MRLLESEQAYRSAAAQGATQIGLTVVVYDSLALDLTRAGEASARKDIAMRCHHCCHALQVLGHLESWLTYLDGETLRTSLLAFYSYIRSEVLRLQQTQDSKGFQKLADLVGETRAAWQRKEQQSLASSFRPANITGPESANVHPGRNGLAWSA